VPLYEKMKKGEKEKGKTLDFGYVSFNEKKEVQV
jgi:hypothetical protein